MIRLVLRSLRSDQRVTVSQKKNNPLTRHSTPSMFLLVAAPTYWAVPAQIQYCLPQFEKYLISTIRQRNQRRSKDAAAPCAQLQRARIREHHKNHQIVAQIPVPPLERDEGLVRPKNAEQAESNERYKRQVARDEVTPLERPHEQDDDG